MKHTPGPWRVRCAVNRGDDLKGTDKFFHIAAGSEDWRDNKGHFHPDDAKYVIDEIHVVELGYDRDYAYPEGGITNEADAYLIAAAPELLESAIDVLRWAETPIAGQSEEECREKQARTGTAVCSKLRAAIAKATGELR